MELFLLCFCIFLLFVLLFAFQTQSCRSMFPWEQGLNISISFSMNLDDYVPNPAELTQLLREIEDLRTIDYTQDTRVVSFIAQDPEHGGNNILEFQSANPDLLTQLLKSLFTYFDTDNLEELVLDARRQEFETLVMRLTEEGPRDIRSCLVCAQPSDSECARCGRAAYCSVACQRKDWIQHRSICYQQDQN